MPLSGPSFPSMKLTCSLCFSGPHSGNSSYGSSYCNRHFHPYSSISFSFYQGSLYVSFLARYEGVLQQLDFWLLWLYAMGALAGIYVGKFLVIKTIGWILRFTKASDAYIFVVFMVNKMTGIFLLPVLLLMAFPSESLLPVVVTLSLIMLVVLLAYRFLISYRVVRNEIKVNPFHFFIYLCAFEIAPLLLIYKVLLNIVERTI